MPQLIPLKIENGCWEGLIIASKKPALTVHHRTKQIDTVELTENGLNCWRIHVHIPVETLCDGVQTYVIRCGHDTLGSFSIMAGKNADNNLLAKINTLQAELDLLKSAFRRHCSQTGIDPLDAKNPPSK